MSSRGRWAEIWEETPAWHGHAVLAERLWTFLCECGEHAHFGSQEEREVAVMQHVAVKHQDRPIVRFRCQTKVPCSDCKGKNRETLEGFL